MDSIDAISVEAWKSITEKSLHDHYGVSFKHNSLSLSRPLTTQSINGIFFFLQLLVEMNQHLLNSLGAGHESIDSIVNIARTYNCPTKLTGAGGGGCVIVHVNKGEINMDIMK